MTKNSHENADVEVWHLAEIILYLSMTRQYLDIEIVYKEKKRGEK